MSSGRAPPRAAAPHPNLFASICKANFWAFGLRIFDSRRPPTGEPPAHNSEFTGISSLRPRFRDAEANSKQHVQRPHSTQTMMRLCAACVTNTVLIIFPAGPRRRREPSWVWVSSHAKRLPANVKQAGVGVGGGAAATTTTSRWRACKEGAAGLGEQQSNLIRYIQFQCATFVRC